MVVGTLELLLPDQVASMHQLALDSKGADFEVASADEVVSAVGSVVTAEVSVAEVVSDIKVAGATEVGVVSKALPHLMLLAVLGEEVALEVVTEADNLMVLVLTTAIHGATDTAVIGRERDLLTAEADTETAILAVVQVATVSLSAVEIEDMEGTATETVIGTGVMAADETMTTRENGITMAMVTTIQGPSGDTERY